MRDTSESITPVAPPGLCPECRSTDLTTTSKTIDRESYWRCRACGEIWNAGRRETGRRIIRRW